MKIIHAPTPQMLKINYLRRKRGLPDKYSYPWKPFQKENL